MIDLESKHREMKKWLSDKKKSTKANYLSAMDAYIEFTKLNPTEMIDEVETDREKKVREQGTPEQRVKDFRNWLLTEYRQRLRGRKIEGRKRSEKVGVSENLANSYCGAIKSFYDANGFPLKVKLPKPKKRKENFKLIIRGPELSKLMSVTTSLRDRAIMKFAYESCQGASEICSPNLGDITKYEEDGMAIWQFHLLRKKTGVEYFTEIGPEAIALLELYFEERKRSGEKLTKLSPVFAKEGAKKFSRSRIAPNLIENMFKVAAIKSGLVTVEQMEAADVNPARPHSLRSSGMSILKLAGMNPEAVEFRSGHQLGEQRQAYWMTRPDELRKLFRKHYGALRVQTGLVESAEERIRKLEDMLAEKMITINALQNNGRLKVEDITKLREEVGKQRQALLDLSKYIEDQIEADREAIRELQKWREDFTRRYKKDVKQKGVN